MSSFETHLIQALGGLLFAMLTAAIGVITPKVKGLIQAHTSAKTAVIANDAIDGLTKIAVSVVSDFNQRIVNDMKSKGAWTPQLAEQVKEDAVAAVKSQGASFIKLSGKTSDQIESLVSTLVEQAVAKAKSNK